MTLTPDNHLGQMELYLPTTVGRALMGKPNKFTKWCREKKILHYKGKSLRANLRYENRGYLLYQTTGDDTASWEQVYFTDLGYRWISKKFKEEGNVDR